MKNTLLKTICTLGTVSAMTLAHAGLSIPSGWYVEGNYGVAKATSKTYPGISSIKNTGKGWSANIGYKFVPYFGIEAGFTRYMPTRFMSPANEAIARDTHTAYDVAAKLILPVASSGLELFGKLGVARIRSQIDAVNSNLASTYGLTFNTSSQEATGLYAAGGAQYFFSPSIAANAQWSVAKGNSRTGNLQLVSLGLSYLLDPAFT